MYFDELTSISPIDGRYRKQTEELATYFSEFALIKWRIFVEVEYFISLFDKKIISSEPLEDSIRLNLKKIYTDFDREDCEAVKRIEKITNHDVKAVEYFLKERIISLGLEEIF